MLAENRPNGSDKNAESAVGSSHFDVTVYLGTSAVVGGRVIDATVGFIVGFAVGSIVGFVVGGSVVGPSVGFDEGNNDGAIYVYNVHK